MEGFGEWVGFRITEERRSRVPLNLKVEAIFMPLSSASPHLAGGERAHNKHNTQETHARIDGAYPGRKGGASDYFVCHGSFTESQQTLELKLLFSRLYDRSHREKRIMSLYQNFGGGGAHTHNPDESSTRLRWDSLC